MDKKQIIRKILKEDIGSDNITRIAVFDFDGTLSDTPMPDTGRVEYEKITGSPWLHKGWWGRPETLDMDIFDIKPIPSVISAYKEERANPNTLVVMLTGRIPKLSSEVEKILSSYGLRFDVYEYNNGGATLNSKIDTMERLLKQYPNVKSIKMWDDRLEHIPAFKAWGSSLDGVDFNITVVEGNHHGPQ
jgi:hypothetical protein